MARVTKDLLRFGKVLEGSIWGGGLSVSKFGPANGRPVLESSPSCLCSKDPCEVPALGWFEGCLDRAPAAGSGSIRQSGLAPIYLDSERDPSQWIPLTRIVTDRAWLLRIKRPQTVTEVKL
eukprot:1619277-Amphidinium_carterae.2